jgi:hypothetical protein
MMHLKVLEKQLSPKQQKETKTRAKTSKLETRRTILRINETIVIQKDKQH